MASLLLLPFGYFLVLFLYTVVTAVIAAVAAAAACWFLIAYTCNLEMQVDLNDARIRQSVGIYPAVLAGPG